MVSKKQRDRSIPIAIEMADLRHKREDLEFHRGLEELVHGHLDGCISSLASSDADEPASPSDVRCRRHSDLDDDDLDKSSVASRHSRILSHRVARQAEEMMITTIERRNRESKLLALVSLHNVSTLDSSFLHDPHQSPSGRLAAIVAPRASSVLQMWCKLEEMSTPRERRSNYDAFEGWSEEHQSEAVSQSDYASNPGEDENDDDGDHRSSSECDY